MTLSQSELRGIITLTSVSKYVSSQSFEIVYITGLLFNTGCSNILRTGFLEQNESIFLLGGQSEVYTTIHNLKHKLNVKLGLVYT